MHDLSGGALSLEALSLEALSLDCTLSLEARSLSGGALWRRWLSGGSLEVLWRSLEAPWALPWSLRKLAGRFLSRMLKQSEVCGQQQGGWQLWNLLFLPCTPHRENPDR